MVKLDVWGLESTDPRMKWLKREIHNWIWVEKVIDEFGLKN